MADETSVDGTICGRLTSRAAAKAISEVAGGQDGLIAREHLLLRGVTADQISYLLTAHRLIEIHRGVYAVGHRAITRKARLRAATMIGTDVGLRHFSAAEWWALVSPRTGKVHVTSPRRIRRPGIVAAQQTLPADELETDDGILLTSVSRTLFDLAGDGRDVFESSLRKAEFRNLTSRLSVPDLLARYPGARGSATIRQVLGAKLYLLPTESWLEDLFLPFLLDRGIELPETNVTLEAEGHRYRVDCFWPSAGLVVELDGRDAHAREMAFESDRERDGDLLAAGYRVLRITRLQVEEAPDLVERRLRAALSARVVRSAP